MANGQEVRETQRAEGARYRIASWLMLALFVPSTILNFIVALTLLASADLEGSEPMREQGFIGWLVVVLGLILWPLPAYFGVWFGLKARALGQGAAAMAATVINGAAIVFVWVVMIVTTLDQL